MANTLEDPDYYLRHFRLLLSGLGRYRDLLSEDELKLLNCADTLSEGALRLLVRLLSRRGDYFRISKLSYADIPDLAQACHELKQHGFVTLGALPGQDILTSLITRDELAAAISKLLSVGIEKGADSRANAEQSRGSRPQKTSTKQQLIAFADDAVHGDGTGLWPGIAAQFTEDVLRLDAASAHDTLRLLYFGNAWQQSDEFVVTELGYRRYENYGLDEANRRFDSRPEVELALLCADVARALEDTRHLPLAVLEDMVELLKTQLSSSLSHGFSPEPKAEFVSDTGRQGRKLRHLLSRIAREYERRGLTEQALGLYQGLELVPARERRVRCLEALGRYQEAFDCAMTLFESPLADEEYHASLRMLPRLAKKAGLSWRNPAPLKLCELKLELAEEVGPEYAVIKHFEAQGIAGWHLENSFSCGLFGLALWDILFAPVKGAFDHPFQTAPSDMYQPEFSTRRQAMLDERLLALNQGDISMLSRHFHSKHGIANDWVNWTLWSETLFASLLPYLTGTFVASLVERLLPDLRARRSGFPDLVLIRDGQLAFVEVKGPGDRLADHQKDWLSWLGRKEMVSEVLWVTWRTEDATDGIGETLP
ncbi:VRR-NUC domain-containing protein [Shewanella zhangzhouensis]|uniref:VRR-NUC domain-containing protein n=1 Tax=Shewanella zhangzhouensis TaxID=2864213 RepID=UPI001C657DA4|nr:VRR-NUC domain-containing protein [Shewanella zhangzhouensis]QYK06911.1 VRR-NUC domain-containing protein [Shewanella zhangzhouensis]